MTTSKFFFKTVDDNHFEPTEHVSGGWNVREQHIAPAIGLLAHLVQKDHHLRGGSLNLASLRYDILGVLPLETVETKITVLRPGKTIELVEATLSHNNRAALVLRAWLLKGYDTTSIESVEFDPLPKRENMTPWRPADNWPGGFIASLSTFKDEEHPGRARSWAQSEARLLDTCDESEAARLIGLLDLANGLTPKADPRKVIFPNLDFGLNLFREPQGEWIGFDTRVSYSGNGVGLTHSVIHDDFGAVGTLAQTTTLRILDS